ncbi:MAG: hypothetical protein JSR35_04260, partial [Proteobacteria bacterium]|nr:hypothetical protein [Pseudomonadota bacterium]
VNINGPFVLGALVVAPAIFLALAASRRVVAHRAQVAAAGQDDAAAGP